MKAFELIHADAAIVVVDKAAGVLTVPTARRERSTLVDLVARHLGDGRGRHEARLVVVHRLDRDTSGVLVFARTEDAARALMASWRREHRRSYVCLVHGAVARDAGELRSHLVTGKNLDRRSSDDGSGELAVTRWRVQQRLDDASLVEVELETGRRNQIRVHMAELGHPIFGDVRYARHTRPHPRWQAGRLALHARLLTLLHPHTRAPATFEAPLPPAFVKFISGNRGGGQRSAE